MICASCGSKAFRECRQCPRHGGRVVCAACCKSCACYDPDPNGIWTCRYYIDEFDRNELVTQEMGARRVAEVREMLMK